MQDFSGKLAVITGGGTGMGRALALQLVAEGCDVAMCDVIAENMAQTKQLCEAGAPQGVKISTHLCDVSDEDAVNAFRDAVMRDHDTDHIHLLFNNAGVGGGGSFIKDNRDEWERTFNICWNGVYYCSRAFMQMLINAKEAHLINTSSVNGFWATIGAQTPHTAYSSAKFAVKGFSEALINDLKQHAPHVKVSVVMPGHIGTSIVENSGQIVTGSNADDLSSEAISNIRTNLKQRDINIDDMSDDDIKAFVKERARAFRENAPTTADEAATVILDGVRDERWRILIGDDAHALDRLVRANPEEAYESAFLEEVIKETGWNLGL